MALAKILSFPLRPSEKSGDDPADALIAAFLAEAADESNRFSWHSRPADYPSGRAILAADPALQPAIVTNVTARLLKLLAAHIHGSETWALRALIPLLCRRKLAATTDEMIRLVALLESSNATWSTWVPVVALARAIERWTADNGVSPDLREELVRILETGRPRAHDAEERKALTIIEGVLGGPAGDLDLIDANDDWGHAARQELDRYDPQDRARWIAVLAHAAPANGAKPTKSWLKSAHATLEAFPAGRAEELLVTWLGFLRAPAMAVADAGDRESARRDINGNPVPTAVLTERNGDLLRGLIWFCLLFPAPVVISAVGTAAESCFKKIPSVGARSVKAGNACLSMLGAVPGLDGVTRLQRLRQRVKQASALTQIEKALESAGRREGMTRDDLADLAVPTFDLVDGRRRVAFGDAAAEIVVAGPQQIDVQWYGADGKQRKAEPAEVKRGFPDEFKAFKRLVDDLRRTLPAQRDRIETLPLDQRSWRFIDWRARYLEHPLLAVVARRLIWVFGEGDDAALGAWRDGAIVGGDDAPLTQIGDETWVALWHPIDSDAATVERWQLWLERHGVTQPFKQAHREIYVLTDAERTTESYSNRFAAHILRQHQLQALCQARGWHYRLQGGFDNANVPTRELPGWNLATQYWVEPVVDGDGLMEYLSHAGVSIYVTTDQVRFRRNGWTPIPVADVPPIVFSEMMRDVDLFVGVCSVGNDPTWGDQGPVEQQGYWHDYAFGDLSASAKTRRIVLERLVPRLKIAFRCEVTETSLVVRGDLRTYKIHLGSGNILMEPNNQYLCIVHHHGGGANEPAKRVFLPFEGDGLLSVILSKAFLLADDRAITDPTIRRQIGR